MIFEPLAAFFVVLLVFLFSYLKKSTSVFFLFLIPLFAVLGSIFSNVLPYSFVTFCMFVSAFAISFFPLVFFNDSFKKNLGLLIFVCLLVEWDWVITWYYVLQNSSAELNFLINVSSFWIFTVQKISPLILLSLLFLIARKDDRLMRVLDMALIVIASCYYLLFIWHLYVVSVVSLSVYYLLLVSLFTGSFSATRLIRESYYNHALSGKAF